jgi:hypothetical protein
MRPDYAAEYVGDETTLKALIRQGLLTPKIKVKGLTVYDRRDLDAACTAFKSLDD